MNPTMRSTLSSVAWLGLLIPILILAGACSDGSSNPTDPGDPTATGTASVTGEVSTSGNTSGDSRAPAAGPSTSLPGGHVPAVGSRGPSPATSGGPANTSAADSSGAGIVVRVQGTSIQTTTGASGAFQLDRVPHGTQVLVFESSEGSAGVPVQDIQPQETIRLEVQLEGSNATVTNVDRDGGEDEEEPELALSLQVSPDTWDLDFEDSSGSVTTFIRGEGFQSVLLDTIVLVGDDPDAEPLEPFSATVEGNHVRSRFAKNRVLDLLLEPDFGTVHTVALQFEVEGVEELQELTAQITIEDDGEDEGEEDDDGDDEEEGEEEDDDGEDDEGEDEELGDLSLQLSPSTWNTNFDKAGGHVTAFIRGTGLDAIDTDSVELVGDDPEADPLPATTARLEGNHVRAQFPQNQVLDLLDEPEPGSSHTVVVRFTSDDGAETHELEATVRIVGPPV